MPWIVQNLWLIPALPMFAAALSAVAPQRCRRWSASLAIGSMALSFLLSLCAFARALGRPAGEAREWCNIPWFELGGSWLQLGWVLDPLTAVMLEMVTFVGLLIFIYSAGYMAHDGNFTRFFTFLSLFAGAMLGVVIANSLLLLFICWELVGLTSYLLIGFWYHKPSAAAAAKKAFITTRIGDVALLLGMVWLYAQTGTLLFYDGGNGCLERNALIRLIAGTAGMGMAVSTAIGLLLFAGAVGKSGQVPLHVWLPDAMEGPTPVSALIHAATMVAAGVFLVARVFPLMAANEGQFAATTFSTGIVARQAIVLNETAPETRPPVPVRPIVPPERAPEKHPPATVALKVVTWVGAITALFAASIAVAQNDIKRILAYSTVSQLGYMMMGLGVGGVAVGMFHLITHAFFKALLFLGAGSVIHGCHEEQDIRRLGGLRKFMPATFATYAIGMMALSGVPLVFSGFWSKDGILHAAHGWSVSHWPFYIGLAGALLTAFYMTRQVALVFFGRRRTARDAAHEPHESPAVMTVPLMVLAACSILLGFLGTPWWPWFQEFLGGPHGPGEGVATMMILSSLIVFAGIGLGWWFYGRKPVESAEQPDPVERLRPDIYSLLKNKFYVDELYEASVIRFNAWFAGVCDWLDRWIWNGAVQLVSAIVLGLSWFNRFFDEYVVNLGFDAGCRQLTFGGKLMARLQDGRVQHYLRVLGIALAVLVVLLIWGWTRP